MSINATDHIEIIDLLKSGTYLIKQKSNGKRFLRQYYLHIHEEFISYIQSKKLISKPKKYFIQDIDELRMGFRTNLFQELHKRNIVKSTDEHCCFTILYNNHRNEEHFIAPDADTRNLWINGLQYLINENERKRQHDLLQDENWILKHFRRANRKGKDQLKRNACYNLLKKSFHIEMPKDEFHRWFNNTDKSRDGALNSQEFLHFFRQITRRKDLYQIMIDHTENGHQMPMNKILMTSDELTSFIKSIEYENINAKYLIDKFEGDSNLRRSGCLSLDGFRNMLLSQDFDILNPFYVSNIYQDMTKPLCNYYINTSHNTYLFYSQVIGDSNPEAYNRALLTGCRAVELDCYDGDDGKPIVKHAYTLVKPCSFESIIHSIEPNLFKTSPYPVILNIENHCSPGQQREMARILKTFLGDKLITKPLPNTDPTVLPSPEDLKYRVLIRSAKKSKTESINYLLHNSHHHSNKDDINEHLMSNTSDEPVTSELSELFVYLQNVPYQDSDYANVNYSPFQSSSLSENTFMATVKENPIDLIQQTLWRLLRIYPGGLRQDSSNLDPVMGWNFGVQMVALNYQEYDDSLALCYGKFLDNGGCGYVLKPYYLLNPLEYNYKPLDSNESVDYRETLTIKIISAQFLPRSSTKASDIPDPYVQVSTHGLPCDTFVQKTDVINNNGFDPIWNQTFRFFIKFPEMCLLYISVIDHDTVTSNDRLAYFSAPLQLLKTGYRHIQLHSNNNDRTYSTLFVHVEFEQNEACCTRV